MSVLDSNASKMEQCSALSGPPQQAWDNLCSDS
ncbi:hypothetical protein swp_4722 [Shewanella piezotolerans WP3]|uniref:Uncharacterized protein n=1 Tax=Shewanella piezotolerans (strain WP3 / JCM 13877) TaxID=225849 RepID=B8CTW3_SHEPW|nr:hypothetical protein swp_4722 [Shewanella piezotolerans WP3]